MASADKNGQLASRLHRYGARFLVNGDGVNQYDSRTGRDDLHRDDRDYAHGADHGDRKGLGDDILTYAAANRASNAANRVTARGWDFGNVVGAEDTGGAAAYGAAAYGTAAYGTAAYGTAAYGTAGYGAEAYGAAAYGAAAFGAAASASNHGTKGLSARNPVAYGFAVLQQQPQMRT